MKLILIGFILGLAFDWFLDWILDQFKSIKIQMKRR